MENALNLDTVKLAENKKEIVILDQTLLPNQCKYLNISTAGDIWEAIYSLRVRGAPAIGVTGAYAYYVLADQIETDDKDKFVKECTKMMEYINSSRPTAVNLSWALNRMEQVVLSNKDKTVAEIKTLLKEESIEIQEEDIRVCKAIGEYGLELVKPGDGILTHCNAGKLATSKYGTATAPIYLGQERGYNFHVFADETRPLLQGARLTAFELHSSGVDVTLICDNMSATVMKNGWVNAVFVGCDRVAANGDAANKIGTSGAAILAQYYGIPFYIAAPTSTIDFGTATGADIVIEERSGDEIKKMWYSEPMAVDEVKTFNPSFDVTEASLITGIITEYGVLYPPYDVSLAELKEKIGRKEK